MLIDHSHYYVNKHNESLLAEQIKLDNVYALRLLLNSISSISTAENGLNKNKHIVDCLEKEVNLLSIQNNESHVNILHQSFLQLCATPLCCRLKIESEIIEFSRYFEYCSALLHNRIWMNILLLKHLLDLNARIKELNSNKSTAIRNGVKSILNARDYDGATPVDVLLQSRCDKLKYYHFSLHAYVKGHSRSTPSHEYLDSTAFSGPYKDAAKSAYPFTMELFHCGTSEFSLGSYFPSTPHHSSQCTSSVSHSASIFREIFSGISGALRGSGWIRNSIQSEKSTPMQYCSRFPVEKLMKDGCESTVNGCCFHDIVTSAYHTMGIMSKYAGEQPEGESDMDIPCGGGVLDDIYVWGHGKDGRLGIGPRVDHKLVHIPTSYDAHWRGLTKGDYSSSSERVGLKESFQVQLGMDSTEEAIAASSLFYGKSYRMVSQIALSDHHSLFLLSNGLVYGCGCNSHGQLGTGYVFDKRAKVRQLVYTYEPRVIDGFPNNAKIKYIAAGAQHSLCVDSENRVYAWGSNEWGQCGSSYWDESNEYATVVVGQKDLSVNAYNPIVSTGIECKIIARPRLIAFSSTVMNTIPSVNRSTNMDINAFNMQQVVATAYSSLLLVKLDGSEYSAVILECGHGISFFYRVLSLRTLFSGGSSTSDVVQIAGGDMFHMALLKDGRVMEWHFVHDMKSTCDTSKSNQALKGERARTGSIGCENNKNGGGYAIDYGMIAYPPPLKYSNLSDPKSTLLKYRTNPVFVQLIPNCTSDPNISLSVVSGSGSEKVKSALGVGVARNVENDSENSIVQVMSIAASHTRCGAISRCGCVYTWRPSVPSMEEYDGARTENDAGMPFGKGSSDLENGPADMFLGKFRCQGTMRRIHVDVVRGALKAVRLAIADTHLFVVSAMGLQANIELPYDNELQPDASVELVACGARLECLRSDDLESVLDDNWGVFNQNSREYELESDALENFQESSAGADSDVGVLSDNGTGASILSLKCMCELSIVSPRLISSHTVKSKCLGYGGCGNGRDIIPGACVSLITLANVLEMIEFGRSYHADVLVRYCLEFVRMNFEVLLVYYSLEELVAIFDPDRDGESENGENEEGDQWEAEEMGGFSRAPYKKSDFNMDFPCVEFKVQNVSRPNRVMRRGEESGKGILNIQSDFVSQSGMSVECTNSDTILKQHPSPKRTSPIESKVESNMKCEAKNQAIKRGKLKYVPFSEFERKQNESNVNISSKSAWGVKKQEMRTSDIEIEVGARSNAPLPVSYPSACSAYPDLHAEPKPLTVGSGRGVTSRTAPQTVEHAHQRTPVTKLSQKEKKLLWKQEQQEKRCKNENKGVFAWGGSGGDVRLRKGGMDMSNASSPRDSCVDVSNNCVASAPSLRAIQAEETYILENSSVKQYHGNNKVVSPWYVERKANQLDNLNDIMKIQELLNEDDAAKVGVGVLDVAGWNLEFEQGQMQPKKFHPKNHRQSQHRTQNKTKAARDCSNTDIHGDKAASNWKPTENGGKRTTNVRRNHDATSNAKKKPSPK